METAAFTAAAEQYQDMVYRIALARLGQFQDAEDAVQEVFFHLYRQKDEPNGDSLRFWLIRVTVHYCRDILRSPLRKRRVSMTELAEQQTGPIFDRMEQRELFDTVMTLPEKYRTVLYLFYYDDVFHPDVVTAMLHNQYTMERADLFVCDGQVCGAGGEICFGLVNGEIKVQTVHIPATSMGLFQP